MKVYVRRKVLAAWMVLAMAGLGYGNAFAADAELEQARALMHDGKAADAYALLEKQEFERAGDAEFDTLLGVAALDSGKPDKATLAFERVLAVNPDNAGARLDMARAYYSLGDNARARKELDIAAASNPPPAARLAINSTMAAIEQREQARRTVVSSYLESFAGYDDNITSVVGDFTGAVLATYNLPGFQPTGNAVKRSSSVLGISGGAEVTHQVSDAVSVFSGIDARYRNVVSASNYSSQQLDLRGGASYTAGVNVLRGSLVVQGYRQRTDVPTADRNAYGVNAEWRRFYGDSDQSSVFVLATRQRFPDIAVNDINAVTMGASWLHTFAGTHKPLLYAMVTGGRDKALTLLANGADNGKRSAAGRFYGQFSMGDSLDLFSSLGYMYRLDRSMNARSTIIDYGYDRMSDLALGCNWRLARNWTLRPQVTYSENRSNIALSEYKHTEATVTVRYDFR